jgi:hypothetical protein
MKKHLIAIPVIILLFIIYIIDRVILLPLFWMDISSIRNWLYKDEIYGFNTDKIKFSVIRVLTTYIVAQIVYLIF